MTIRDEIHSALKLLYGKLTEIHLSERYWNRFMKEERIAGEFDSTLLNVKFVFLGRDADIIMKKDIKKFKIIMK